MTLKDIPEAKWLANEYCSLCGKLGWVESLTHKCSKCYVSPKSRSMRHKHIDSPAYVVMINEKKHTFSCSCRLCRTMGRIARAKIRKAHPIL